MEISYKSSVIVNYDASIVIYDCRVFYKIGHRFTPTRHVVNILFSLSLFFLFGQLPLRFTFSHCLSLYSF